jgi:hypothetical protein
MSSPLFRDFWIKLLSLALAILIWFTVYIIVQQEHQVTSAPARPPENTPTNTPTPPQ